MNSRISGKSHSLKSNVNSRVDNIAKLQSTPNDMKKLSERLLNAFDAGIIKRYIQLE